MTEALGRWLAAVQARGERVLTMAAVTAPTTKPAIVIPRTAFGSITSLT
jgi:hypothetical protein